MMTIQGLNDILCDSDNSRKRGSTVDSAEKKRLNGWSLGIPKSVQDLRELNDLFQSSIGFRSQLINRTLFMDVSRLDLGDFSINDPNYSSVHLIACKVNSAVIGGLVGFVRGWSSEFVIGRLAVQREYRGKGVGTALMNRAKSLAVTKNCTNLWLEAMHSAIPFYVRQGFLPEQFEAMTLWRDLDDEILDEVLRWNGSGDSGQALFYDRYESMQSEIDSGLCSDRQKHFYRSCLAVLFECVEMKEGVLTLKSANFEIWQRYSEFYSIILDDGESAHVDNEKMWKFLSSIVSFGGSAIEKTVKRFTLDHLAQILILFVEGFTYEDLEGDPETRMAEMEDLIAQHKFLNLSIIMNGIRNTGQI